MQTVTPPSTERVDSPTTRRVWRHLGRFRHEWRPLAPLAALTDVPDGTRVIYTVGAAWHLRDDLRAWAEGAVPAGWAHGAPWTGNLTAPVVHLRAPWGPVEVHRAAQWFGEGTYTAREAQQAHRWLTGQLAREFGDGARPLTTPGATGREMFLRTISRGASYPTLPDDLQALIRSTSGQGRIETMPAPHDRGLMALHSVDARLQYAALVRHLAVDRVKHDSHDYYEPYAPGRYSVRFTVPTWWEHVGILPVKAGDGWEWPNEPGSVHETWCDAAELHVALRHGWECTITERIVWRRSNTDPMRGWRDRLVRIYDAAPSIIAGRAVRSLILHTIGAMHGTPRHVTRTAAAPPARRAAQLRREGDLWAWDDTIPTRWPELAHPEWTAAIWGRSRARLLHGPAGTGALALDPASVVAFRTDAIYATRPFRWIDTGKVGDWRTDVARSWDEPRPWPRNGTDVLVLARGAGRHD